MFNEAAAKKFSEIQVHAAVQSQQSEFRRWEKTDRFNWDTLADDPRKMFPWILQQRAYWRPIYDWAVGQKVNHPQLSADKIDYLGNTLAGKVNEILAYFNYAAQHFIEDGGMVALNRKRTKDLIIADANYLLRHHPTKPVIVEGRMLGKYEPDASLASTEEKRLTALLEATLQKSRSNQQKKGENRRIASIHHRHLIGSHTEVDLGVPKDSPVEGHYPGVSIHELQYSMDEAQILMEQFYWMYKPSVNAETVAQILPELASHRRLQLGVLLEGNNTLPFPAYTQA